MNTTTVAIDLAKDVFQLAVADAQWRVVQTTRLNRRQLVAWFENRTVDQVIMEACGSAHHWAAGYFPRPSNPISFLLCFGGSPYMQG